MMSAISSAIMPLIIFGVLIFGLIKKVNIYECFLEGAKNGIETSFKIIPPLVALMVSISMLKNSGALNFALGIISPVTNFLKIPKEVMPLALMRPISGSASLAIVAENLASYGPDSLIGRITSVMMGSTETTFYTIAVYFGSVGIKNIRHTAVAATVADVAGILCSVYICRLMFA